MDQRQALDELKAIRQIMDRARRKTSGEDGWFMVAAGVTWFVSFLGTQYLPERAFIWFMIGVYAAFAAACTWLWIRSRRRGRVKSSIWRLIALWWIAAAIFDAFLIWALDLTAGEELALLIILTIALGYVQFGLFTHWAISVTGAVIGVLAVGASYLVPDFFFLAMGVLGGGTLVASGLWLTRQGE
jgi:hypothetical protein